MRCIAFGEISDRSIYLLLRCIFVPEQIIGNSKQEKSRKSGKSRKSRICLKIVDKLLSKLLFVIYCEVKISPDLVKKVMINVNAMNLQLTNQEGLRTELTKVKSLNIGADNTVLSQKEIIDVQQEVEELKKLRESVTGIEEYIQKKAVLKAHLKAISNHLCNRLGS